MGKIQHDDMRTFWKFDTIDGTGWMRFATPPGGCEYRGISRSASFDLAYRKGTGRGTDIHDRIASQAKREDVMAFAAVD